MWQKFIKMNKFFMLISGNFQKNHHFFTLLPYIEILTKISIFSMKFQQFVRYFHTIFIEI